MISFRRFSIPNKIVAIIMISSGAALLLASGALIAYDFNLARRDLGSGASVFAQIVADNTSAAVSFRDQAAAVETLSSLRAEASILASCIYTPPGLFAQYVVSGSSPCPATVVTKAGASDVVASAPILLNGKEIGTVQIHATLAPAYAHLRMEVATIGVIFAMAVLFAFALSSQLQKFVSEPILSLADTANEVSRRKDYAIRATKQNEDEIGVLVDAFNDMLAEIQRRDHVLQDRAEELLQASRMKDEFLATLSHELRTPLNSILGWAVLVQQEQVPRDRQKSALQAIERNARVQARLIEDLLDVSRIISGKLTLDSSQINLRQIVESAIEVVQPAAEAKQTRIVFQKPGLPVRITGDAARIQQVVWNLLSNAVKFTPNHGLVTVRLEETLHSARISVSDNGQGIAPEFLPYVFDRFRQADSTSTRRHGGLGLGLAIVRYLVEMHGGSVSVESEGRNQGATFTIELPRVARVSTGESFRLDRAR